MKEIYKAASLSDAHIFCGVLQSAGIHAIVQGDTLAPLRGMLPMTVETNPTVRILNDADEEKALQILEQYQKQAQQPEPEGPWTCSSCNEEIEPQFTDCWNCGASRLRDPYR